MERIELILEDLRELENKTTEPMSKIIWQMAISICEMHLEFEKQKAKILEAV